MGHSDSVSEIRRKSARGIKWQVSTEIFSRFVQLGITFVLARLLQPSDFGLIGMALIFTQLAFVLFDLGLSSALIQKKKLEARHYRVANAVYGVTALLFYALVFLLAGQIALFFHQPLLRPILRFLGLIFFLFGLRATPNVQLTRAMRFKAIGLARLISILIYGILAVALAKLGFGVWSFVYGMIGQEAVLTVLTVILAGKWLMPGWDGATFKELTSFGSQVLGSRIMGYLNINLPNILIGRWMGSTVLGYYSVGYQLVDFPVQRISKNILRVMFPAFSKLQDKIPQYQQLYKDTVSGLMLVVFPIFAGIALVAPEFVHVFYGPKWRPLIPVLQILTVVGLMRSIWVMTSVVFLSKGKPKWELLINAIYFVTLGAMLMLVYVQGLLAVVATIAALIFLFTTIAVGVSARLIRLGWRDWLEMLRTPVLASLGFSLVLMGLRGWGIVQTAPWLRLTLFVLLGAVVYLGGIYLFDRKALLRLKNIFGKTV